MRLRIAMTIQMMVVHTSNKRTAAAVVALLISVRTNRFPHYCTRSPMFDMLINALAEFLSIWDDCVWLQGIIVEFGRYQNYTKTTKALHRYAVEETTFWVMIDDLGERWFTLCAQLWVRSQKSNHLSIRKLANIAFGLAMRMRVISNSPYPLLCTFTIIISHNFHKWSIVWPFVWLCCTMRNCKIGYICLRILFNRLFTLYSHTLEMICELT